MRKLCVRQVLFNCCNNKGMANFTKMFFCKPVKNKLRYKPHRLIDNEFTFTEFDKAAHVNTSDWNKVLSADDFFLQLPYLELTENCGNVQFQARYVLIYKKGHPCTVIYYQLTDFKAEVFGNLLINQINEVRSKRLKLFEKYIESKNDEDVLFRMITCGNNLISGEYGYKKTADIDEHTLYNLIFTITRTIASEEDLRGKISAVLFKDFYKPIESADKLMSFRGQAFSVEPNLILQLPKNISSLEEYLSLFSKKYRNRFKSVQVLGRETTSELLNADKIKSQEAEIYSLYEKVYERAKFKLLKLPENYFSETKKIFDQHFGLRAFYYGGELCGFSSWFIIPGKTIETHYIGIDYEINEKIELYQNILLDYVQTAIQFQVPSINFGRTAAEIKTTIGARPHDLVCYIQPQNALSKILVKPFIEFLQPKEWIPRNPFKSEE